MLPTLGRIVIYRLNELDVTVIRSRALQFAHGGNPVHTGEAYPAMVVCANGARPNLKVFLDGFDNFWAYNRPEGDGAGQWHWPERKPEPANHQSSEPAVEPNE